MIQKMKSLTSNNSLTNFKKSIYSIKKINNLSNRIKSLQNDIDKIKSSKKKKDINHLNKIEFEKNLSMVMSDSNIKDNKKNNKLVINKTFVKNPNFFEESKKHIKYRIDNTSKTKNNSKIEPEVDSSIHKKIKSKKLNNIIHEKKNFFLNINSNFKTNEKRKKIKKDFCESFLFNEIHSPTHNFKKLTPVISADKINQKFNFEAKEKIEENKESNFKYNLLDIEFELRCLKKRMKLIKNQRKELKEKLFARRKQNQKLEDNIIKEHNYNQNIIDNLILLNKEYLLNKNQNEFEYFEDSIHYRNKELTMKDILFNIMDMKFEYENNNLYDKFIEGLNEFLSNLSILNMKNSDYNIANKINRLLHIKNKLQILGEKYEETTMNNSKYYIYFTSLFNKLNLKNFNELKEYITNLLLKNIQENKRFNDITNALINDSSIIPEKKKQSPKMKYINNANILNKKEKNRYYLHKHKNRSSNNININNGFRNKRNNSLHFHGLCYNSFLNTNHKRNLNNTNINKNYFRSGVVNDNEFSKINYYNNDIDIYPLKEEEKN